MISLNCRSLLISNLPVVTWSQWAQSQCRSDFGSILKLTRSSAVYPSFFCQSWPPGFTTAWKAGRNHAPVSSITPLADFWQLKIGFNGSILKVSNECIWIFKIYSKLCYLSVLFLFDQLSVLQHFNLNYSNFKLLEYIITDNLSDIKFHLGIGNCR